jgi:hypothetical protein
MKMFWPAKFHVNETQTVDHLCMSARHLKSWLELFIYVYEIAIGGLVERMIIYPQEYVIDVKMLLD